MSKEDEKTTITHEFWRDLDVPHVTIGRARAAVEILLAGGLVPALVGHAGIGKTDCFKQICRDRDWGYIAYYTQTCTPEDIAGLPFLVPGKPGYSLMMESRIHEMVDKYPQGGIVVFEEPNRAPAETSAAVFAFMDQIHRLLPSTWRCAMAMNPSGGDYAVNSLTDDHAFRRRVGWICVTEDVTEWLTYAQDAGMHPLVVSFIQANTTQLLNAKLRAKGVVYPNPAAWEQVSNIIKALEDGGGKLESVASSALDTALSGKIGATTTTEFLRFITDHNVVIHPQDVLDNYAKKNSEVRRKVRKALQSYRTDVVASLCDNLSATLLSSKPAVTTDLADNLATFLVDLPNDMRAAFAMSLIGHDDQSIKAYVQPLQQRLAQNPKYRAAIIEIVQQSAKVEEKSAIEAEGSSTDKKKKSA